MILSENQKKISYLDDSEADPNEIEKSAETIFKEVVRQYDLQMDSHDTLKDKANSIIIATGTIITLVTLATIQILNLEIPGDANFLIGLIIIPYFFLIFAAINAIRSYLLVELTAIDAEVLIKEYHRAKKVDLLDQLSANIAPAVNYNKQKAHERKEFINNAMKDLERGIISFAALLLTIFLVIIYSNLV